MGHLGPTDSASNRVVKKPGTQRKRESRSRQTVEAKSKENHKEAEPKKQTAEEYRRQEGKGAEMEAI